VAMGNGWVGCYGGYCVNVVSDKLVWCWYYVACHKVAAVAIAIAIVDAGAPSSLDSRHRASTGWEDGAVIHLGGDKRFLNTPPSLPPNSPYSSTIHLRPDRTLRSRAHWPGVS